VTLLEGNWKSRVLLVAVIVPAAALLYSALQESATRLILTSILLIAFASLLHFLHAQRTERAQRIQSEKIRRIQEVANLRFNTIEALAIAINAKDQTTHGHVRRTQIYAAELGNLLKVSEGELEALKAGALLHDVGKLVVPEHILNKPGKLTAADFEKMKVHTLVGGDIIKRVNFPYPVEDIVRFHHEKWDGSGYPEGLIGEEIPLVARIISVVDFYDATRCDRPYRTGMSREDSLALMRRMSGSSFDPHVVEIFCVHVDRFDSLIAEQDIREQFAHKVYEPMTNVDHDADPAPEAPGTADELSGFRSIATAQREVFALHEIAQTIGSSLNLQDSVTLVSSKLRGIITFDVCIISVVNEKSGQAYAAHVDGDHEDIFARRPITIGEGITGWVIANARSMYNTAPELDLIGIPDDVASTIHSVLVAPLMREDGAFGAITLYSTRRNAYSSEHVRLLESVTQHVSSALNNALIYEKTMQSALTDPLTDLPNARAFHLMLEQRLAECQRYNSEPLSIISINLDNFQEINDSHGHGIGDHLLADVASAIRKHLRQMDALARYAGDEFVAILPMAAKDVAATVADRIRTGVEEKKFTIRAGRTVQIGISLGVASFPADGETSEILLTNANRLMQRDKHARKLSPEASSTSNVISLGALR